MTLAASITGNGTTLHLNNSSGVATVGGAPTAANTTPFIMVDEQYTIQAPTPAPLWSGGPPLRHGSDNLDQSYPNVSDSIVVACYGSSPDNLASLIRQLNQVLTSTRIAPVVYSIQPTGHTNAMYTEISTATVQPTTDYHVQPLRGSVTATLRISFVRHPFFGSASLTTLINGTAFTNDGTSNHASLGSIVGDLYDGMPLNIKIAETATFTGINFYLAAYKSLTKTSPAEAKTTSSTTGIGYTTTSGIDISSVLTNDALKIRLGARFTTLTNPGKMQFRATLKTQNGGAIQRSPWIGPNASWSSMYLDFGKFSADMFRNPIASTALAAVAYEIRSTDGTSVTATLAYHDLLTYWDFARYVAGASVGGTTKYQQILAARKIAGGGWLPNVPSQAYMALASDDSLLEPGPLRGTEPRAWPGANLWLTWTDSNDNQTTTATANVTANQAPLYFVARGAG